MIALNLSLQLVLMIGIGLLLRRTGVVRGDFDAQLAAFILDLALPCQIIRSLNVPYSPNTLKNCFLLMVFSLGVLAVQISLGHLCFLLMGKTGSGRILRFGLSFTNFTFVGMPVVEALYGQQGLFYFVVFLVPMRMIYYSAAKPLLSPPGLPLERRGFWQTVRGLFPPPVTSVIIGLALYLAQFQLPGILSNVITSIGSTSSPLGMILSGIILGRYDFRHLLNVRYLRLPLLRNLAMPALFFALSRVLPIDRELSNIIVIFSALPVASLLSAYTLQYDPDPQVQFESAGSVLSSTLFSAVTIPLWAQLLSL